MSAKVHPSNQPPTGGGTKFTHLSGMVDEAVNKSNKEKMQKHKESCNLARLQLSGLRLHGREKDLNIFSEKLNDIENLSNELIMVAGNSGCGKSSLVTKGLQDPAEKRSGTIFCRGKFDQNRNALPYSAFVESLADLSNQVLASKDVSLIKSDIKDALGEEDMRLIAQAMKGCRDLFPEWPVDTGSNLSNQIGDGKEAVRRMQYALRMLMKTICSKLAVVMFIDDLQWADGASRDLLFAMKEDVEIRSLLLVGAYRENEVLDDHPLAIRLSEAEKLTTIKLKNLEYEAVRSLVAETLRMENEEQAVDSLVEIIHKKTDGNPFFVLTFLTSIYEEELLQYNLGTMQWNWNNEAVRHKLSTINVSSVLVRKLQRFKLAAQNIAKVASCLGASFSTKVLAIIVQESSAENDHTRRGSLTFTEGDDNDSTFDIDTVVEDYENEGLWERETNVIYRFAHDQVQSAALELIPPEERDSLMGIIGGILLKKLDESMIDEMLFVIASLMNHESSSLTEEERLTLVKINTQAGIKASKNAAFDAAVIYFQAARELIGPKGWEIDQDLMIRLTNAEAEARFVIGDFTVMEALIDELLSKDIPIKDKFHAYDTKILAATTANRFDEALSTALLVRKLLGFKPIPTKVSKITVIREYIKTNKVLKGLSTEDIVSLPDLTDERVIMGQKMMERLMTIVYQSNPSMYPVVNFRMIREGIKSGINRSTCDAFATFGLLLCGGFGDVKRGRQMGETAELLLAKPGMRPVKSHVTFIVETMVFHWTAPVQNTVRPLINGYQAGLASGDIESACFCICMHSWQSWYCSAPLDDLLNKVKVAREVCIKLNNELTKMSLLSLLQLTTNLVGDSEKPWVFSGEYLVFEEIIEYTIKTENYMLKAGITISQLELFVMFQRWLPAKELLMKAGDLRPHCVGLFGSVRYTFLEGLICLKAAQASQSWVEKRGLKARAKKSSKIMRGWLKNGNINVLHALHLLAAESAVLDGDSTKAEKNFKVAALAATRSGFLQDKALIYELFGNYYMSKGENSWADYSIKLAHTACLDWKAKAKVKYLTNEYPQFIEDVGKY